MQAQHHEQPSLRFFTHEIRKSRQGWWCLSTVPALMLLCLRVTITLGPTMLIRPQLFVLLDSNSVPLVITAVNLDYCKISRGAQ
jgi:hypothetical protein